jgi:putative oxidoreductase
MITPNPQSTGVWYDGIAIIRIVVGLMLIFHGWQLFQKEDMNGFAARLLDLSVPFPAAMAYAGKFIELIGGFFLILGLFTRLFTALLFITFMFITFVMGEGKIFTDNQHPFLFAIISLLFFFTGAGRLSIDYLVFINRKEEKKDAGNSIGKQFGRYVSKS